MKAAQKKPKPRRRGDEIRITTIEEKMSAAGIAREKLRKAPRKKPK